MMIWVCPKLTWIPSQSSHLPFLHVEELILKIDASSFSKSLVPNNHIFLPKLKLLRILDIRTCSKIRSISEGELRIMRCPALRQRCQMEIGEDWNKISHIPKIFIDDQKIK
ncbi:hypothetical protein NE237_007846 [Protea cynaroides]|uniref:Uncharacterized protein n=1 Tax=Protea cynaroides TaxID=273540 RepID=A0A9Q0KQ67_9MAGN|nr:hypothetical protein NE237_007846 [Protea cynaroides]